MKLSTILLAGALTIGGFGGCGEETPKFTNRVDGKFRGYDVVTFLDDTKRRTMIVGDFNVNEYGYIVEGPNSIETQDRDNNGYFDDNYSSPRDEQHPLTRYADYDSLNNIYNLLFVSP